MIGKVWLRFSSCFTKALNWTFPSSSFVFREFRIELREDPSSVFASDIVIENTNGPIDFDLSRVYSGKLEGKFAGREVF